MRPLLVTLAFLAFVGVSTQLLRHIHVTWVVRKISVLDEYKDETEEKIAASTSLEELVKQHAESHRKLKEWEKQNKWNEQIQDDDKERIAAKHAERHKLKSSSDELKDAIREWEDRSNEILELHFFWCSGLGCLLLGVTCFLLGIRWFGVAAMALGFAEMIYWTSPSFTRTSVEAQRLLFWKLTYAGTTLFLLVLIWAFMSWLTRPKETPRAN